MYRIGCKWGLHLNTLVGLYGNDIDVRQYFQSPTGLVRYIGDPAKTSTSWPARPTCRCSANCGLASATRPPATAACTAVGVPSASLALALATDQTPNAFLSDAQMANYVNSNGSMILHGLQAGVEWNY